MAVSMFVLIINLFFLALVLAAAVYLFLLLVRALRKYIGSKPVREEKAQAARSLGGDAEGTPDGGENDAGICGGDHRRQPSGRLQVGERPLRPQYHQSDRAGQALRY